MGWKVTTRPEATSGCCNTNRWIRCTCSLGNAVVRSGGVVAAWWVVDVSFCSFSALLCCFLLVLP
jgi:hypothetical protein